MSKVLSIISSIIFITIVCGCSYKEVKQDQSIASSQKEISKLIITATMASSDVVSNEDPPAQSSSSAESKIQQIAAKIESKRDLSSLDLKQILQSDEYGLSSANKGEYSWSTDNNVPWSRRHFHALSIPKYSMNLLFYDGKTRPFALLFYPDQRVSKLPDLGGISVGMSFDDVKKLYPKAPVEHTWVGTYSNTAKKLTYKYGI